MHVNLKDNKIIGKYKITNKCWRLLNDFLNLVLLWYFVALQYMLGFLIILKTVSKLHIPKKLVMANFKHIWYYVVLWFLCYCISNVNLNFPMEFTIFDFYDASFM